MFRFYLGVIMRIPNLKLNLIYKNLNYEIEFVCAFTLF